MSKICGRMSLTYFFSHLLTILWVSQKAFPARKSDQEEKTKAMNCYLKFA